MEGIEIVQLIKGTVAGLVALAACPCHLPITLPALLLLTSGTALGGWLAANQGLVWLASFILSVGGLALAIIWFGQTGTASQCEVPPQVQKPALTTNDPSDEDRCGHPALIAQTEEVSHV